MTPGARLSAAIEVIAAREHEHDRIAYTDVLTVLLIGAIAGVVAHVPAGLGVFEFVFLALLSHVIPEGRLIAALLGYRAIYYIVPLMVAAVLYLVMEAHARQRRRKLQKARYRQTT